MDYLAHYNSISIGSKVMYKNDGIERIVQDKIISKSGCKMIKAYPFALPPLAFIDACLFELIK